MMHLVTRMFKDATTVPTILEWSQATAEPCVAACPYLLINLLFNTMLLSVCCGHGQNNSRHFFCLKNVFVPESL